MSLPSISVRDLYHLPTDGRCRHIVVVGSGGIAEGKKGKGELLPGEVSVIMLSTVYFVS